MPEQTPQTLANHVRWHPPFHYVLLPILGLHFVNSLIQLVRSPDFAHAEAFLLSIGLFILGVLSRVNALKAQDRVIRLEEQLRFQRVLPAELAAKASAFPSNQIVALRFASDADLPELARQVAAGKLVKGSEIKQAIKNWRADHHRV